MVEIIESEEIICMKEVWEKERQEHIELTKAINKNRIPSWITKQFGDGLKGNSYTYANGALFDKADCNVCGKHSLPEQKVVKLLFSFCDEHSCRLCICGDCIKRWFKMVKAW